MKTDTGSRSRATLRAASAATTRAVSAMTAASRADATASNLGCSSALAAAHCVSSSGGGESAGTRLRRKQSRMGDLDGRYVAWRHDHSHAQPGRAEQACGKVVGHPDTAMRRRMSRQRATVERDARPRDALHVRHVGIVIQVRVVLGFFLDDGEDTGGRLASLLAARYRRPQETTLCVID